ncbi:MAG: hypothetical protein PVH92_04605 [Anaerolineales bacterium]|jgi:hypothetical protein
MKKKNQIAGGLAVAAGLLGILATYLIFMQWYGPARTAEAAEPGCEILLGYLMPALSDFGILGGVLYLVAAYGFFASAGWAFPVVILANVLALQGSWFINVPMMAAGLPPIYFIIFWPNLLFYFLFTKWIGERSWGRTLLGLATGMAFIFCFMNGVASWSRIITIGRPIFLIVQRLNWVAFIGFGVLTVGLLLRPKEWMRVLGISAALLELVVGIPLVVATTISLGRFSLFSFGPIMALVILVLFLWPGMWEKLIKGPDTEQVLMGQQPIAQGA